MDTNPHTSAEAGHQHPHPRLVEVKLNGEAVSIPAGTYTGASLKRVLGVPPEHELEQAVGNHKFRPISNEAELKIHGGEQFVSHCGQGQSS